MVLGTTALELREFAIEPARLELKRGATLDVQNTGAIPHNLMIERPTDTTTPSEHLAGTSTFTGGGEEGLRVQLPPGRYALVSTVGDHRNRAGGVADGPMSLARVTIYALSGCGPCRRARHLLGRRGIPYSEVCGDDEPAFDRLLLERTGGLTVPQVVIDGVPIGGADSLERLDRLGVLAELAGDTRFPVPRVVRRLSVRRVLEMYLSAGDSGPWIYHVELVDRDGRVLERRHAPSADEAAAIADSLRSGGPTGTGAPTTNGRGPDH